MPNTIFRRKKYPQRKLSCGFLLIELMSALVIFAGITVILAQFYGHIICWQREAKLYTQATQTAHEILEKILVERKLPDLGIQKDPFNVRCQTIPVPAFTVPQFFSAAFLKRFSLVEVSVTWKNPQGANQKIVLMAGMSKPEREL